MQIADKYSPEQIEQKWYDFWIKENLFHSEPDEREPYTIVIPPPNVTGMLHMGHMLNNTLQDVLIRRARMQGKNACWVPGTDHASISHARSSSLTPGSGRRSTVASSSSSCASWVLRATGSVPASLWIRSARRAC